MVSKLKFDIQLNERSKPNKPVYSVYLNDGTDDMVQPHIGMLVCDDIDYEYDEDGDVKSVYLFMKKICIALFVKGYGLTGFTFEGDEYALPKQKDE